MFEELPVPALGVPATCKSSCRRPAEVIVVHQAMARDADPIAVPWNDYLV
jgi:hypothetical protein